MLREEVKAYSTCNNFHLRKLGERSKLNPKQAVGRKYKDQGREEKQQKTQQALKWVLWKGNNLGKHLQLDDLEIVHIHIHKTKKF